MEGIHVAATCHGDFFNISGDMSKHSGFGTDTETRVFMAIWVH